METLFALDNVWIALLLKVVAVLIIFLTVPLVMGYMGPLAVGVLWASGIR